MNYVQTKQRNIVGVLNKDQLKRVIGESINYIRAGLKIDVTIKKTDFSDVYEKEDMELEMISRFAELATPSNLALMKQNCSSYCSAVNSRCTGFLTAIERVSTLCNSYTLAYIPLTQVEKEELCSELQELLSHGANFLYYQFNMIDFIESVTAKTDPVVNIELASYCTDKKIKFAEVIKFIRDVNSKYRATMEVFEEYPEYEEAFIAMVGPYYQDFEKYMKLLNLNVVKRIISGALSVEDALTDFAIKCVEDSSLLTEVE